MMIGVEFVKDRTSKTPDPELRDRVEMETFNRGVILLGCNRSERSQPTKTGGDTKDTEPEVTATEDLMREHGVLNRILLIYEFYERGLRAPKFDVDAAPLRESAEIIRDFIENYHEKLEEDHLFPRFEKANKLVELTGTLRLQHKAGRVLTEKILRGSAPKGWKGANERMETAGMLGEFIRMYRPHEAGVKISAEDHTGRQTDGIEYRSCYQAAWARPKR